MINTIQKIATRPNAKIIECTFLGYMIGGPGISLLFISLNIFDEYMEQNGPILSMVYGATGGIMGWHFCKLFMDPDCTLSNEESPQQASEISSTLLGEIDLDAAS